jgi:hypothetical protein
MSSGSRLDSLSPLPPSSRLLEPINQIRIRIPNETREISKALFADLPLPSPSPPTIPPPLSASKQSERIAKKTSDANHKTKARVLSDLHNRLKVLPSLSLSLVLS